MPATVRGADIAAEIERLHRLGLEVAEPTTLPWVAVFTDFTDPWGNRLGLYQDIAGPGGRCGAMR